MCPRAHSTAASTGKATSLGGVRLRGPHATFITFIHSYSRGVPMRNIAAALNHQTSASIRMGRKQLRVCMCGWVYACVHVYSFAHACMCVRARCERARYACVFVCERSVRVCYHSHEFPSALFPGIKVAKHCTSLTSLDLTNTVVAELCTIFQLFFTLRVFFILRLINHSFFFVIYSHAFFEFRYHNAVSFLSKYVIFHYSLCAHR